jgi:two-component system chemotaxis response regulator CheB
MLVEDHRIRLTRTAKEHHTRPAIDPLFRSAALAHQSAVIGMVLSGRLDDGTAGLLAIKACGGIAVVQDPDEAQEPSMPRSALRHVAVDHCVPSSSLARLCVELVGGPLNEAATMPAADLRHEHAIDLQQGDPVQHLDAIGTRSTFTCPDCQGTLWEVSQGALIRYRCHTGHAFTLRTLIQTQSESTGAMLWSALRALSEKQRMLNRLVATAPVADDVDAVRSELGSLERHVAALRDIVQGNLDEPQSSHE